MEDRNSVHDFYNSIHDHYTEFILRCVPRYSEMQWAILNYIPDDLKPEKIMDLGCGPGNLTDLIITKYPDSEIHLVDSSEEMIRTCEKKYAIDPGITMHCTDFRKLNYDPGSFDLILSSISIHHITDMQKSSLFSKIHQLLKPSGIFCYSDQFSSENDEIYEKNIRSWKEESFKNGATEEEWQMWMDHQEQHDHHSSLDKQLSYLKDAGFTKVDCVWRYLLWTVVIGFKET